MTSQIGNAGAVHLARRRNAIHRLSCRVLKNFFRCDRAFQIPCLGVALLIKRRNDVIKDFTNPELTQAVLYKPAVRFFSSSALVTTSKGIYGLMKNVSSIQMIASP